MAASFEESIDGDVTVNSPIRAIRSSLRQNGDLETAPVGPDTDSFAHPEKLSDGIVFSLTMRNIRKRIRILAMKKLGRWFLEVSPGIYLVSSAAHGSQILPCRKIIDCLEKNGVIGLKTDPNLEIFLL